MKMKMLNNKKFLLILCLGTASLCRLMTIKLMANRIICTLMDRSGI